MPKHKLSSFEIEGEPEEDEYEVEDIVDFKIIKGQPKYLVKWKGFSDEDNTWEPEDNMTNLPAFADKMVALKAAKTEKPQGRRGRRASDAGSTSGGANASNSKANNKAASGRGSANANVAQDEAVAEVGNKRSRASVSSSVTATVSGSGASSGGFDGSSSTGLDAASSENVSNVNKGELVFKKSRGPHGQEKVRAPTSVPFTSRTSGEKAHVTTGSGAKTGASSTTSGVLQNSRSIDNDLVVGSASAQGGSHKHSHSTSGSVHAQDATMGSHGSHSAQQGRDEEDAVEVEDLLDYKPRFKKDYFLVRWKGEWEDSWEPRRNLLIVGDLMHKMNDLKMSYMRIYGPSEMEDEVFVTVQSIRISGAATLSAVVIEMTRDTESRSLLPLQEVRRKWPQQLLDFLLSRLRLRSSVDVADENKSANAQAAAAQK